MKSGDLIYKGGKREYGFKVLSFICHRENRLNSGVPDHEY